MSNLTPSNEISKVCIITDETDYAVSNQLQKVSIESMTATNIHDCNLIGDMTVSANMTVSGGTLAFSDSISGNTASFVVPDLTAGNINLTLPATSMTLGGGGSDPVYWIGHKNTQIGNNQGAGGWRYIHTYVSDASATPTGSFRLPLGTSDSEMYFQVPVEGVYALTSDITRSSATGQMMIGWLKKNGSLPSTSDGIWGGIDIGGAQRLHTSAIMYLTTTDYVSLAAFVTTSDLVPQDTSDFNRIDTAIVKIA